MPGAPEIGTIGKSRSPTHAGPLLTISRAVFVLVKAPLTLMAAFPAACAFLLSAEEHSFPQFTLFLTGTLLSAFGAAALNQWSEHPQDATMSRTRDRPIPAKLISPGCALMLGLILSGAGAGLLFAFFPLLAGILALTTILLYWLVYTPLKRHTPWCTEVGAVAGALPALLGSAAGAGSITPMGWSLFAIVFLWQMPHFHPIAWRYRTDYRQGGFRMLTVVDETGRKAANWSFIYALLLVASTAAPVFLGAGALYWVPATGVAAVFLQRAAAFRDFRRRDAAACSLFRFSLIYLAVLLSALLIDHWT